MTDKEIQEYVIQLFATLSAGHGRSIEILVSECNNNNNEKNNPVNVTKVILDASETLTCIRMKNPYLFFQLILLGDLVQPSNEIDGETYESLVAKGVFIHSFQWYQQYFIPSCPGLFLFLYK